MSLSMVIVRKSERILLLLLPSLPMKLQVQRQCRHYATKYTAKITSTSATGRTLSAEVTTPSSSSTRTDPRGYALPRLQLVCKAAQLLVLTKAKAKAKTTDPLTNVSNYLRSLSLTLTSLEASLILKSLNNDPRLALQFFHFCPSHSPYFRHCPFTYNRIFLILSKSLLPDRWDIAKSLLAQMDISGLPGNISTVNILIGCCGSQDDLERCAGLVEKWGLRMNSYTYKCLVQAYLRMVNSKTTNNMMTKRALDVYFDMRSKGYKLDIFAYNMLLDALAKDYMVDQAYKVFEDMKNNHCQPDEYTYTIMIRMTGKIRKSDESLELFQEMVAKGITSNLFAYNTVIQAIANGRMVDKAVLLFSQMVENSCQPNEFTYSVLLNVLAAEGQLGRLDEIIKLSSKYMNRSIYAYLVTTLGQLGHTNEAHRLFCNMWCFHDKGDRDAFFSMLESLCSAGRTVEAIDLLSKIHEKGIIADTKMYNTVFSALGRLKQTPHLHDLYEKMKREGPSPDIFTYNILISSYGRAGKVDEAVAVFEELENSDYTPDIVSYNSLINCLGKNGEVDEAHMRFREMEEKGLNPDVVTYSTLIECFGKSDKVEMASRLFDVMLAKGCYPNIVTYNILLDCLERTGRTAEAVNLYAKLKQDGLTPDSITYAVLERLQSGSHGKIRIRRKNPITGWVVSSL